MLAGVIGLLAGAILASAAWAILRERERRQLRRRHALMVEQLAKLVGLDMALRVSAIAGVIDDAATDAATGNVQVKVRA